MHNDELSNKKVFFRIVLLWTFTSAIADVSDMCWNDLFCHFTFGNKLLVWKNEVLKEQSLEKIVKVIKNYLKLLLTISKGLLDQPTVHLISRWKVKKKYTWNSLKICKENTNLDKFQNGISN